MEIGESMKKIVSLLIIISILILLIPGHSALAEDSSPYILEAYKLNSVMLLLGTNNGFELLRAPQRVEAAVMLVRLLGGESEALMNSYDHPFTDVPEWADPYVGFLYKNNLTKGIGNNLFDPYSVVDAKTYLTFLMRSLGYSDDNGDFTWEEALSDSLKIELISNREYIILANEEFTRGHMTAMSYNAVNALLKNSDKTLISQLIDLGAVDKKLAVKENFLLSESMEKKYLPYLKSGEYMPDLAGLDLITAEIMLRKSGINNYSYKYEYNELINENYVISSDIPAYIPSEEVTECVLTVSRGPSVMYHDELLKICTDKGWSEEITPYIIASAKYLIKNTVLSKYDIYSKLNKNLNEIVILNEENSAGMGFAAVYDAATKNMYINRYILDYNLILHELSHVLSNNYPSNKVGFPNIGDNTRIITEAFSESIASRSAGDDSGSLNYFKVNGEEIIFTSDSYFCDSENNYVLGVFSPLFLLAGENAIEKMYFKDIGEYSKEVLSFNEKYGEGMWDYLWNLADFFIEKPRFLSETDREAKAIVYREYLDGILDCLNIDLNITATNETGLKLLLYKTREIKKSFPLTYSDYRQRMEDLEREIISRLKDNNTVSAVAREGNWVVPDYKSKSPEYVYNSLTIEGEAASIGYMVIEDSESNEDVLGVIYKKPDQPIEDAVNINKNDQLPLKGEYIIMIREVELPEGDYRIMRDLKNDFASYIADYKNLSDYSVGKLIRSEGFSFRYEFSYYDFVAPAMAGRILDQFPAAGTAILQGKTIIRLFMVKEKLK